MTKKKKRKIKSIKSDLYAVFGTLKEWKIDSQKMKEELRRVQRH